MKVATMIANEMFTSHDDEIKHLSKEALRHEIKLIIDKKWASSDPEKLIENVEQEIHKIALAKQVDSLLDGRNCTKSSWPTPKIDKKWLKEITDEVKSNISGEWISPWRFEAIARDENQQGYSQIGLDMMINLDQKLNPESYTEEPRCPFCGASYADWYNEPYLQADGSEAYLDCEACGKLFAAKAYIVTRFSSRKIEE